MRKIATILTVLAMSLAASTAPAQMQPMTPPQGQAPQPPAGQGHHPMMGQSGGMMCPMMSMMMGAQDPKAMARMLKMRGEMMKAMGEIMMRHGTEME